MGVQSGSALRLTRRGAEDTIVWAFASITACSVGHSVIGRAEVLGATGRSVAHGQRDGLASSWEAWIVDRGSGISMPLSVLACLRIPLSCGSAGIVGDGRVGGD